MRVHIDEYEVYPEYVPLVVIAKDPAAGFEVDQAFMDRYRAALGEWQAVQAILCDLLEGEER